MLVVYSSDVDLTMIISSWRRFCCFFPSHLCSLARKKPFPACRIDYLFLGNRPLRSVQNDMGLKIWSHGSSCEVDDDSLGIVVALVMEPIICFEASLSSRPPAWPSKNVVFGWRTTTKDETTGRRINSDSFMATFSLL